MLQLKGHEIWYPGSAIVNLLRYQIVLASCTKWRNSEELNDEIILKRMFKIMLHLNTYYPTILYRKPMKCGIQEELLLISLDTKLHWLRVQNGQIVTI